MKNIRVLLIDDDRSARRGLSRSLRIDARFEITDYEKGVEALEHLENVEENHYTAVLLDFVLEPFEMSGREVLDAIKDRHPRLPVIVFTGKNPDGGLEAFGEGAYGYMQRPIDKTRLINKIEAIAEQDLILRGTAHDVRKMLNSDVCLTWRLDRHSRQFHVVAWDGDVDEWYRENIFLNLDDVATHKYFRRGKPLFVPDVTESNDYKHPDLAEERGWISLISIPLIRQDHIIGLIDSYTCHEYEFADEAEKDRWLEIILPAFARQAAASIRNAELSTQQQTLQDINRVLGGSFEEETVIRQILSKGLELVGADFGWLYSVDQDAGKLDAEDWIGISDQSVDKERDFGEGITGWVAKEGQTKNVPDVSDEPQHKTTPNLHVESEIAVPLRREEQTIGVLTAKSRSKNAFTDDDADLLMSLASQAVVVIERANLIHHVQEVSTLALAGDFQKLADYVVEAVHDLTGAEVILWKESEREKEQGLYLRFAAGRGAFDEGYDERAKVPTDPDKSITAVALKRGRPIVIKNVLADEYDDPEIPRFYNMENAERLGWRSFLAVPLLGHEREHLGSLSLYSKEEDKFGEPEIELMRTFANQAAIAIENARQQEAQVKAIEEISISIATLLDLDEVLDRILKWAITLMGEASLGEIRLLDEETGELVVRAYEGKVIGEQFKRIPIGEGITGWVAEHKEVAYAPNVREDERYLEFLEGTRSEVAVPMLSKEGDLIGVLNIEHPEVDAFDEHKRKLAKAIASLAVVAIENAQSFQELDKRANQLTQLQEVTASISAEASDLDKVLNQIVHSLMDIFQATSCVIRLYDAATDEFGDWVADGISEDRVKYPPRPDGTSRYVVNEKEPRFIEDASVSPSDGGPAISEKITSQGVKAAAHLPLIIKGNVIGVLYANLAKPHKFSQNDKQILNLFAHQAAIAIENARLFEQLEREKEERIAAIKEIGFGITAGTDLKGILNNLLQSTLALVGKASMGNIWLLNEETERLEPYAVQGAVEEDLEELELGEGIVGWVTQTGKPYLTGNADEDPHFVRFLEETQSELTVPLLKGEQVIGALSIEHTQPDAFTEDDIPLLEAIASQAAIAIENARLFDQLEWANEQLERKVDNLDALNDIGQYLTSSIELSEEQILDRIDQQASQLMHTDNMYIALYNEETDTVRFPLMRVDGEPKYVEPRSDGEGRTEWIIQHQEPILIKTESESIEWYKERGRQEYIGEPFASWLGVPMMSEGKALGVIATYHKEQEHVYDEDDLEVLQTIASQSAIALRNTRLVQELEQTVDDLKQTNEELEALRELQEDLSGPLAV
jgi:GAF domain-containing protein